MGLIGLGLGLGVFRLADYQIVEADKLRERADARRLLAQTLYAKRGTIYDRNGNVLASSVECRNIAVNPQLVEDVDKTVSALVKATGIDKKTCRQARRVRWHLGVYQAPGGRRRCCGAGEEESARRAF